MTLTGSPKRRGNLLKVRYRCNAPTSRRSADLGGSAGVAGRGYRHGGRVMTEYGPFLVGAVSDAFQLVGGVACLLCFVLGQLFVKAVM